MPQKKDLLWSLIISYLLALLIGEVLLQEGALQNFRVGAIFACINTLLWIVVGWLLFLFADSSNEGYGDGKQGKRKNTALFILSLLFKFNFFLIALFYLAKQEWFLADWFIYGLMGQLFLMLLLLMIASQVFSAAGKGGASQ